MKYFLILVVFYSVASLKQRHNLIKALSMDLDDKVVALGLIDDNTLHYYGSILGLCKEIPGQVR